MTDPYIGARYTSSDSREFKIVDLPIKDQDPWVDYVNSRTGQRYSCRLEAFLSRFRIHCE